MTEHKFPWEPHYVVIAARAKDDPNEIEVFNCECADGGYYYPRNGSLLAIDEIGWIPFAWTEAPPNQDEKFPDWQNPYPV